MSKIGYTMRKNRKKMINHDDQSKNKQTDRAFQFKTTHNIFFVFFFCFVHTWEIYIKKEKKRIYSIPNIKKENRFPRRLFFSVWFWQVCSVCIFICMSLRIFISAVWPILVLLFCMCRFHICIVFAWYLICAILAFVQNQYSIRIVFALCYFSFGLVLVQYLYCICIVFVLLQYSSSW